MKPTKTHLFIYFLVLFTYLSCTSAKVKNLTNKGKVIKKIENVEIIAQNENIIHNGEKIGDFVLKENPIFTETYLVDWDVIKSKMKDLAISSGANLIEINRIGYAIKGHVFYVDGNLFYTENAKLKPKPSSDSCSLVIFRDRLESLIGSAFTIDIKIGEKEFNNINKNNYAKNDFDDCYKNIDIIIIINNNIHSILLDGESKYFTVSKSTNGNVVNGGMQIGVGNVVLVEIEDQELGRLIMLQK